uniref:Uncharacterized protein n=1 Tax=Rhizophora mucronata TaxID=61149 RepID=A0A2P2J6C3_RHIMU
MLKNKRKQADQRSMPRKPIKFRHFRASSIIYYIPAALVTSNFTVRTKART